MTEYVYNDNDSTMPALSAKFASRVGDSSGHHEEAFHSMLELLAHAISAGAMIDVGCGMGRTTAACAGIVNEVVALEPDEARCNYTRDLVRDKPNATVLQQTTQQFIAENPGKQFDLVVLGMVIQHLPTHLCDAVLADLATLCKPGGLTVVATTHALEKARCFTHQHVTEGRLLSQISREAFDAYAADTDHQDKGLPVRRFSRSEFESVIPDAFEIVHWGQYSYFRPEHIEHFAWLHSVEPHELANTGNSQYLVLRRRRG